MRKTRNSRTRKLQYNRKNNTKSRKSRVRKYRKTNTKSRKFRVRKYRGGGVLNKTILLSLVHESATTTYDQKQSSDIVKKRIISFVNKYTPTTVMVQQLSIDNIYHYDFRELFQNLNSLNHMDITKYQHHSIKEIASKLYIYQKVSLSTLEADFLRKNIAKLIYYDLNLQNYSSDKQKYDFFVSVGLDDLHYLDIIDAYMIALTYYVEKFKFKYYEDLIVPNLMLGVINQVGLESNPDTKILSEIKGVVPGWKYSYDIPNSLQFQAEIPKVSPWLRSYAGTQ